MVKKDVILKRLDEIEESVNLGTLDTTIFGLMIFIFATTLSMISIGFPQSIKNNGYLFGGILIFVIFAILLVSFIINYVQTIIFKQFQAKKAIINIIIFEIIFVVLLWIFLFAAAIYEHWWKTPFWSVIVIMSGLFLISILFTSLWIKPRVEEYFKKNFKALLKKANNKKKI